MEIIVNRRFKGTTYTIGDFIIDGVKICDTLEDKDRGLSQDMSLEEIKKIKVYGETAIPTGTYKVDMDTVSPRLKNKSWAKLWGGKLPRLVDVPGFDGILIHPFNKDKEGFGCVAPGENNVKGLVVNSVANFRKIMEILTKSETPITITIR